MDSSFLKSQHPVVEELLTNKYFGDTLLVCANGHLTDNKLAVGLLFPSLLTSDIFALPIENVLLVPDYTMEEIGREFEKLLLQTFQQQDSHETPSISSTVPVLDVEDEVQELVIDETHIENCEPSTSQAPQQQPFIMDTSVDSSLPVSTCSATSVDVQNGFLDDCHNIHIGDTNGSSIQIFIKDDSILPDVQTTDYCIEDDVGGRVGDYNQEQHYLAPEEEDDEGPPDISYYPRYTPERCPFVNETVTNTDGNIPVLKPERSKKTVRFSPDTPQPLNRRSRLRQPKLKLTVVDDSKDVIQNLPGLPDPQPQPAESPTRRSPKKESPVLENRKPGRPKTRPELPGLLRKNAENGITRFKQKSAEWKATEMFKCGVCSKVLSCRGSYERHTRMHQDSKPYKCSHCPKTFGEACKKAVHERVHSGSKPFPCQQCKKSFRTATQRNVHLRSHSKDRPYNCDICGKVFSQPYSVKVHKEKLHKNPLSIKK